MTRRRQVVDGPQEEDKAIGGILFLIPFWKFSSFMTSLAIDVWPSIGAMSEFQLVEQGLNPKGNYWLFPWCLCPYCSNWHDLSHKSLLSLTGLAVVIIAPPPILHTTPSSLVIHITSSSTIKTSQEEGSSQVSTSFISPCSVTPVCGIFNNSV